MTDLLNRFFAALQNLDYLAVLGLVFVAVALAVGAIAFAFHKWVSIHKRISRVMEPAESKAECAATPLVEDEKEGFVSSVFEPLSKLAVPSEEHTREKLRLQLVRGGFHSRSAYRTMLALKVVSALAVGLGYVWAAFTYKLTLQSMAILVVLCGVGFYLPNLVLAWLVSKRQQQMSHGLPDALDLMVVCTEAGLGLDQTFKRVGDEIRPVSRHLSDEFHITSLEMQAGKPREDSYRNLSLRAGLDQLSNLMAIIIQAGRFGTSVAKALRVHADEMRVKRRQLAEEYAAKMVVKLLFPLVLFIFPALFVVLLGPASIRIYQNLLPALRGG